jgi:hypothetical protein
VTDIWLHRECLPPFEKSKKSKKSIFSICSLHLSPLIPTALYAMLIMFRGQDWTEGQGSGERIGPKVGEEEEVKYDALGNPIAAVKKEKKKSAAELRKAKKERMARRKRGEEVFTDEEL